MQSMKLIAILAMFSSIGVFAQSISLTVESKILGEERQILIALPDSYEYDEQDSKYPLVLLTDGEWHFDLVVEATKLLYQDGYPKIIVAAIMNNDRGKDLTPSHTSEFEYSGNANNFYMFITEELLVDLERKYRISNHRTLLGHSLGGLFAAYAMVQDSGAFDAFVAVTPTIRWDNFKILDDFTPKIEEKLAESKPSFFLGIGNETGAEREGVVRLKKVMETIHLPEFSYREYPMDSHVTVPWKAYFDGLRFVFHSFLIPVEYENIDFSNTIAYYDEVGTRFDYDKRVPQRILFNWGFSKIGDADKTEALKIFEYYKKAYPNVPIPYRTLGDINFELKKYKIAKENYEMAYNLFPNPYVQGRIKTLEELLD